MPIKEKQMIPEKDNISRINEICANINWICDAYSVRRIIQRAFPRNRKERKLFKDVKPQAYHLAKALTVLETYLETQNLDEMIEWAYRDDFLFPLPFTILRI